MFRFFKELTSFNTESTATKLLYRVKDRFTKHDTTSGYLLETDNIKNMDALVKTLSEVISSTLDYSKYQKCNNYTKDRIKSLIVEELVKASKGYESEYSVIPVYGHKGDETMMKDKGITMSLRYYPGPYYPYEAYNIPEATHANFPENLFLEKTRLQQHIIRALKSEYPGMLKNINAGSRQQRRVRSSNLSTEFLTFSPPMLQPVYPGIDRYITPSILKR